MSADEQPDQPEERTTDEALATRPDLDALEARAMVMPGWHWSRERLLELIAYARHLEERLEDSRTGHKIDKEFLNQRIAELEAR